ncbi:MAG: hypothetical protein JXB50_00735 [Spirochaetes bacterium]|nr:hypothetical protein [Spirochaetota bacterium]
MSNNDKILNLNIGNKIIGLECPTKEYKISMENYFNVTSCSKESDIKLKLIIDPEYKEFEIPNSLFLTKKPLKNGFSICEDLIIINFNPETKTGTLKLNFILTKGELTRVFEQILYQAFYSACKNYSSNAYLIHSSGVVLENLGFLFIGSSGKGKTTVSDLSQKYRVLNDEINIVEFDHNSDFLKLKSTPFNGTYKNKQSGQADIKAIFLLNHASKHEIIEVNKGEAVKIISKEIVPPIGLEDFINRNTFQKMFDVALKIINKTEVYQLDFLPDAGFWDLIEKKFL